MFTVLTINDIPLHDMCPYSFPSFLSEKGLPQRHLKERV